MDLFKEKPIEKSAAAVLSLGQDDTKWNKAIITEFLSQYPTLQQTPLNLVWKKKEARKGYAVGSISVLRGAVPVIVKSFKVYPFDLIVFPGYVLPLDELTLEELLTSDSPFAGVANATSKTNLALFGDEPLQTTPNDNVFSTTGSRSSYERPAVKVASFLDRIDSFDRGKVTEMLKDISADGDLTEFYNENGNILNKIASKATDFSKKWLDLIDGIAYDRQYMFEDENGNAYIKEAYSNIDFTNIEQISTFEEKQHIKNKYAEYEKVAEDKNIEEFVAFDEIRPGQFGKFVDSDGNKTKKVEIISIEKMASLVNYIILPIKDMNKGLVIDNNSNYMIVNRKIYEPKNLKSLNDFTSNIPSVGKIGVWVVNGVATEIFEIDEVIPNLSDPGAFKIKAMSNGNPVTYSLLRGTGDSVKRDKHNSSQFYVPGNAIFVELKNKMASSYREDIDKITASQEEDGDYRVKVLEDLIPKQFIVKTAEKIENNVIPSDSFFGIEKIADQVIDFKAPHIVYRDTAGRYNLFGPEFNKYASNNHTIHNLSNTEVVWPLVHLGASENEVDRVINMLPGDEIKIANKLKAPITIDEFKKEAQRVYEKEFPTVEIPYLKDFIKIAAKYSNESTVDAVLSLGLVNKFNIMEYLDLITDYERVLSELSRLLLFSRLTDLNFKPEVLEETVSTMNQVLHSLKTLREVLSYNKTSLPSKM